jgi:hypothetical protein
MAENQTLSRTRGEPGVDLRPGPFVGAASRHDSDVSARNAEELFVFAAYLGHNGFRLAGWRDVVPLRDHRQQVGSQPAQIHPLAPDYQLAPH